MAQLHRGTSCSQRLRRSDTRRRDFTIKAAATTAAQHPAIQQQPQQRLQHAFHQGQQQHGQQQLDASRDLDRQVAVIQGLTQWAQETLPQYSLAARQQWQPSALLPDMASSSGLQQLSELRQERSGCLLLCWWCWLVCAVCVGSRPAEQQFWGAAGLLDHSGTDQHVWARWRRQWAADVNKLRSLLSSYCYCCGLIDTHALEVSTHLTLTTPLCDGGSSCYCCCTAATAAADGSSGTGSSSGAGRSGGSSSSSSRSVEQVAGPQQAAAAAAPVVGLPYQQLFKELLQVRMLRVMLDNLTNLANYHGAPSLARITAAAAMDTKRHELALLAACRQLVAADAEGGLLALAAVVRQGVVLPGCHMADRWHDGSNDGTAADAAAAAAIAAGGGGDGCSSRGSSSLLYRDFMAAADCVGVYGVSDSAAAVQELCVLLQVQQLQVRLSHSSAAQAAAAALLGYPGQLQRLAEVQLEGRLRDRRRGRTRSVAFGWVFGRDVLLS